VADKINTQRFTPEEAIEYFSVRFVSFRFVLIPFPIPHSPLRFEYSYALALVPSPFFLTQYSLDVMSDNKADCRSTTRGTCVISN
jgi:hypothetical protein